MRLSVVIPGYNTSDALWKRCLGSVLAALDVADEIICIDDGSRVRPNVDIGDCRVRWIFLTENKGQANARNVGLREAKGEWVTFVDSDDEVLPEVYQRCFEALEKKDSDVVLFGVKTIWTKERLTKTNVLSANYIGVLTADSVRVLFDACLFEYPVNKVYRHSFLQRQHVRFPVGICPGEDTIFNLQVSSFRATWQTIDAIGYVYYRYSGSSLSRYQPTYAQSMQIKAALWKDVFGLEMPDGTPSYQLLMNWDNMWRQGTPYSIASRYRFARKHGLNFVLMAIKRIVRRFFYTNALRRLRIRRLWPDVQKIEGKFEI